MRKYILDTECASLQGGVCELAYLEIDDDINIVSEFVSRVNPERPIEQQAFEVHGISDDDVKDMPPLSTFASHFDGPIIMIAHNARFDKKMIKDVIKVDLDVCTLALSRSMVTGTTNHQLATLQKELGFPEQKSHSALGDVHTVRDLLLYLRDSKGLNLTEHMRLLRIPKIVHKMTFGKHKGRLVANLAPDYREWLLSLEDLDPNLRFTLNQFKGI
jgi:exodeoxyribonuclease X